MRMWTWVVIVVLGITVGASEIAGSWHPESYVLADGSELSVTGLIFFTDEDWTVLFFVEDENGVPKRGSAEGGTYTLEGEDLVFRHLYHLSAGEAVASLEPSPLRMSVKKAEQATEEPCRVDLRGDRMTIHFPSGNRMEFAKSSVP